MIFEKILIFGLFLGPLVFFHELGHFLFARFFGVRVETFSLGFGPKILSFRKGDTDYCLSLIPLGGYVKMFGDDPLQKDEIPDQLRELSFTHKNKWQRFWIVLGGPLANFILAFVLFFTLSAIGENLPEIRVGHLSQDSQLRQMGFEAEDVLYRVNGKSVFNHADLMLTQEKNTFEVKRNGKITSVSVQLNDKEFLELLTEGTRPLRRAKVVNSSGEVFYLSPTRDKAFDDQNSFEKISRLGGTFYLIPVAKDAELDYSKAKEIVVGSTGEAFYKELKSLGYVVNGLRVDSITVASAASKAGIEPGDVIISIDGKEVYSFEELSNTLQTVESKTVQVDVWKKGQLTQIEVIPQVKDVEGKKKKLLGVYSSMEYLKPRFFTTESQGFLGSVALGFTRTWDSTVKTFDGFKKLIFGDVSLKNVGGPLSIGKVASDSINISYSYFFQLMALISINLGLINLFPVPVLDGGHIMFIFLEIINRGPISQKKMEVAQQLGFSLLLLLMIGAIYNDISRFL